MYRHVPDTQIDIQTIYKCICTQIQKYTEIQTQTCTHAHAHLYCILFILFNFMYPSLGFCLTVGCGLPEKWVLLIAAWSMAMVGLENYNSSEWRDMFILSKNVCWTSNCAGCSFKRYRKYAVSMNLCSHLQDVNVVHTLKLLHMKEGWSTRLRLNQTWE